jgi:hypothetical protein
MAGGVKIMPAWVDVSWQHFGLQALLVENELVRLEILPDAGGKMYSLRYKPADAELFWQNPRVPPAVYPPGTPYDDTWAGGWDDVFPNVRQEEWRGMPLHDHGELWTQRWRWEVIEEGPARAGVHLWCLAPLTPARLDKWITLTAGEPIFRLRYRLSNIGPLPFHYMWNLHAAVRTRAGVRIDLPADTMVIDPWDTRRFDAAQLTYTWPTARGRDGRPVDVSRALPPEAGVCDQHYVERLREGWVALTDAEAGVGVGIRFDERLFSTCWLFLTYGGWRGLEAIVVEPSTGWPSALSEACAAGRAPVLEAGQQLETEVLLIAYAGLRSVTSIAPDGTVRGE